MTDLSVGIVGCGLIAGGPVRNGRVISGNHAAACREVAGVRLVAAAEPLVDRREAFGKEWNVTRLYSAVEGMLAAENLDLVIVATPPEAHEGICLACARAGVRGILCEKPFTGSATAAQRIIEACQTSGCKLVVNFTRRWDASHRDLAERITAGELGVVRTVFASYTGTLRGNGAHFVDTLHMLVPAEWRIEWVSHLPAGSSDGPIEALLSSENRARAYVCPIREAEYFVFEIHILGTKARARLLLQGNEIYIDTPQPLAGFPGYLYLQDAVELPKMTMSAAFAGALRALAKSVRTGSEPDVSPTAYVSSLSLVDSLIGRATEKTAMADCSLPRA